MTNGTPVHDMCKPINLNAVRLHIILIKSTSYGVYPYIDKSPVRFVVVSCGGGGDRRPSSKLLLGLLRLRKPRREQKLHKVKRFATGFVAFIFSCQVLTAAL